MARANPKWSQIRQDGGHVGTKLALFSVLSASGAHFSRLAAFVAPFGRFFRDLSRSSFDFGTPSWPYGGRFFALGRHFWTWCRDCCQKTLLAFTFCFSFPQCSAAVRAQHMESRSPKTCDLSSILARILMLVARANIKKTCAHAVFC